VICILVFILSDLISDLGLPEVDGYDLIQRIRRLDPDEDGSIPAVALTGFASMEEKKRVNSAGFDLHLAKPIESGLEAIGQVRRLRPNNSQPSITFQLVHLPSPRLLFLDPPSFASFAGSVSSVCSVVISDG
jgi:DNA-binding response OmpR family regulator